MIRLILAVIFTVVLVAFSMANAHHIELSVVFGKPIEIRLIFLLGSTYVLGTATGMLWSLARSLRKKKSTRMVKWAPQEMQQQPPPA